MGLSICQPLRVFRGVDDTLTSAKKGLGARRVRGVAVTAATGPPGQAMDSKNLLWEKSVASRGVARGPERVAAIRARGPPDGGGVWDDPEENPPRTEGTSHRLQHVPHMTLLLEAHGEGGAVAAHCVELLRAARP